MTDTIAELNGLAFSPAEKWLYIIDTGPTPGGSTAVHAVLVGTRVHGCLSGAPNESAVNRSARDGVALVNGPGAAWVTVD